MPSLPKPVQERLASEFRLAADKVASRPDLPGKLYYFSVFYGEPSRQLNVHWDADLALLFLVVQAACQHIGGSRPAFPVGGEFPQTPNGVPDAVLPALDQLSNELAVAFEGPELDLPRFYAALARAAELTYASTGNGLYLYLKGQIKL